MALFILQIIFLFVYISKKLKSIRYFILNYNNKNNVKIKNKNKIDNKQKNKNNNKLSPSFPPPKNNSSNHNKKENSKNNNIINKDKVASNKKKKGKKLKNSKRKLQFMEDNDNADNNLENINKIKNENNLLKKAVPLKNNNIQKIRKGETNLFFSNNFDTFSPYINFQSPILNINNKKDDSERENININNQTNEIKLDKINNNQLYLKENNKIEKTKNAIKNKNNKKN